MLREWETLADNKETQPFRITKSSHTVIYSFRLIKINLLEKITIINT